MQHQQNYKKISPEAKKYAARIIFHADRQTQARPLLTEIKKLNFYQVNIQTVGISRILGVLRHSFHSHFNHNYFTRFSHNTFKHGHKKRKDSLEGSLDPVLFVAELDFP